MNSSQITSLVIAGGILWAAWKYGPAPVKAGVAGVAGMMIAKRVPFVNQYV